MKRLSQTAMIRLFVILAVLAVLFVLILCGRPAKADVCTNDPYIYSSYTVQAGDTLWDIACSMSASADQMDVRTYMETLCRINRLPLDAQLKQGGHLIVFSEAF